MKWLCSDAVVETQQPAESLDAFDWSAGLPFTDIRLDQSVVEPLVIPLRVVMSSEISGRLPERPFSEEDHPVETFILDRPDESLGVSVQVGGSMRQTNDQVLLLSQESVGGVSEVPA